ncbi:MAG: valine--tRNA ligase [Thermodesulfovibrionales bacterium]
MLDKGFNPQGVEEKWYQFWVSKGYFPPSLSHKGSAYSLVIPPPNVTGSLHMGHALNTVIQDILARWKRMSGYKVLWLPGTDHAGIATQNVVERQLASEGLDRHKLGRNAFIERVWKWKAESGGTIIHQLKKLGASCDWSRERFTLDEALSKAVREVFVRLYEQGLIYRDNRLINWCPRCHTALSDLEVEHEELEGKLTYIKYPLSDGSGRYITVATTRPETMLGDTAVAVNPEDDRYKKFIGKFVDLPLTQRQIPVISDTAVDQAFGTGAVKVTPAHDFNDESMAKRQKTPLPFITVIGDDGRMTADAGEKYAGLERYECRKLVLRDLKGMNFIEKEEPHKYAIGHCYRCKTITEPLSTPQWYVNVQSMAKDAIKAVKEERIRIIPKTWENTYFAWMEDIKDWCISRQIWWGHRIPVWYCQKMQSDKCKAQNGIIVSRVEPHACPYCSSGELVQDEDVLDTWFSSSLWPFSTLGWPDNTDDLKTFYPTSVLVTGFDIIFFWVARMIMMGLKFMGDVPFRDVYIHALVRDMRGQKMSKSKGNVVDPLIMIDRYGTDAFRFTLAAFAAQGRDVKFSEDRVEGYRHFVNKLWNAARFIMMNAEGASPEDDRTLSLPTRWILSRLSATVEDMNKALEEYRFNDAASSIYQFIWHEFCDWYIEMAKIEFQDTKSAVGAKWCLIYTLDISLRLLHPFMPYVTEEIWQKIKASLETIYSKPDIEDSIMNSEYPASLPREPEAEEDMSVILDAVMGIRTVRGELNISPSLKVNAAIKTYSRKSEKILKDNLHYIKALARADELKTGMDIEKPEGSATSVKGSMEIFVPLKGLLNIAAELDRLMKDMGKVKLSIASLNKKLFNDDFLQKAPKEIIEKEKAKYEELIHMKKRIMESIKMLKEAEVNDA